MRELSNGSIEAFNAVFSKFFEVVERQNRENESLENKLVDTQEVLRTTNQNLVNANNNMFSVTEDLTKSKEAFEKSNERLKQEIQKVEKLQAELTTANINEEHHKQAIKELKKQIMDNKETFGKTDERLKERISDLEKEIREIQTGIILDKNNAHHHGLADEIKKLIRQDRENGDSFRQIAKKRDVGVGTAYKYGKQETPTQQPELPKRQTPKISNEPKPPAKKPLVQGDERLLIISKESGLSVPILTELLKLLNSGNTLQEVYDKATDRKHLSPDVQQGKAHEMYCKSYEIAIWALAEYRKTL